MNPTIKKWVVRPFLILLACFTILFGIGFVILTTQQQRLVNVAVDQLNKQFKGKLSVAESSVSIFKNFPLCVDRLHDAKFYEDKSKTGKPFHELERLYVGFSVPSHFQDKYTVRRLILKRLCRSGAGEFES